MEKHPIIGSRINGLRLLIIEDEPMLALCVADVVESAGCIVTGVAGTVAEALDQVASCPFDVALLDLHLRGQTVELIVAAIKASGKIAVVSTGADALSLPAEIRLWPVLHKPYKNDELMRALTRAASMSDIQKR
jgi:CheY-like chemotaxis protein